MKLGIPKISLAHTILVAIGLLSLWGQFARWSSPVGKINIHEFFVVFFILFIARKRSFWQAMLSSKMMRIFGLAIGWSVVITGVRSGGEIAGALTGLAYLARVSLYGLFAGAVAQWSSQNTRHQTFLIRSVTLWFLLMAGLGIGQYLLLPDTRILKELGWDDHLSRAFGTLFDPTFYGLITALGSMWMFWYGLSEKKYARATGWAFGFAVLLLATTLSFSRAAYLAYVAGFLLLAWFLRQRRVLLAIPLLLMAMFLVPKDGGGAGQDLLRTQTVEQRVEHIQFQTQEWPLSEMVWGRGWSMTGMVGRRQAGFTDAYQVSPAPADLQTNHAQLVDSQYIQVWLASGALGVLFFGGVVWYWWRAQDALGKAFLGAVLIHGVLSPTLFYPWVLLAMGVVGSLHPHSDKK